MTSTRSTGGEADTTPYRNDPANSDQRRRLQRRNRTRRTGIIVFWRVVLLAIAVGVWAFLGHYRDLVASPGDTISTLVTGFTDGWIVDPLGATLIASVVGFAIAGVCGVLAGIALARVAYLRAVFGPIITGLFAVPRIVLYPAILGFLGITLSSKLWLGALAAFFPIVTTTTAGVHSVNDTLIRVGRSLACNRWQLAVKIYLPAAAPTIVSGLRIAFGVSFVTVVLAELFASNDGLGVIAGKAYGLGQLPRMYAVVFLIFLLAVAGNLLLWFVERWLSAARD